jgi:hypothetical protein
MYAKGLMEKTKQNKTKTKKKEVLIVQRVQTSKGFEVFQYFRDLGKYIPLFWLYTIAACLKVNSSSLLIAGTFSHEPSSHSGGSISCLPKDVLLHYQDPPATLLALNF